MMIYLNILDEVISFLISTTLCKFLKCFTVPNLRKMEITIDFNGNFDHLSSVVTHYPAGECH